MSPIIVYELSYQKVDNSAVASHQSKTAAEQESRV